MNMTLLGERWKVESLDTGVCVSARPSSWGFTLTTEEARELAVALDRIIEHLEGQQ